jgi:pyridoxamine 5'-phosphate oxidase
MHVRDPPAARRDAGNARAMSAHAGSLADLRSDYKRASLDIADVDADPLRQFATWLDEAIRSVALEPTAMTLATASADGRPSARIVLLKAADAHGFVFYTGFDSAKGRDLAANARAALVFFWSELERQVRVEGDVGKVSAADADAYFARRPRLSRLSALASPQSETIPDRAWLEMRFDALARQHPGDDVPRPPHWGGFRVVPHAIEFWQGRPSRLHDRLRYTRHASGWTIARLAP